MTDLARGTFDVQITPAESGPAPGIGQLAIAKQWHGDLNGAGSGLMLSAGDPAQQRAGYVAIEVVEGTLHGRAGGFAFQQLGVMRPEGQELAYSVVPGSGTGELAGLEGTLALVIAEGGTHSYELAYTLA
jgi:hypothetical protein